MKTGKGFRGGTPRYIKRKPRSKEVAEQIKKGDIYSGVMKLQLDLGMVRVKKQPKIKEIIKDEITLSGDLDYE